MIKQIQILELIKFRTKKAKIHRHLYVYMVGLAGAAVIRHNLQNLQSPEHPYAKTTQRIGNKRMNPPHITLFAFSDALASLALMIVSDSLNNQNCRLSLIFDSYFTTRLV